MRDRLVSVAVVFVVGCCGSEIVTPTATCVEQPFRAELHVDAHDLRMVWATDYATGRDVAVRPRPPGTFSFDRDRPMSLLDGDGNLLSFSGEISQSGCFDAAGQTVYFGADDLPDPHRPLN